MNGILGILKAPSGLPAEPPEWWLVLPKGEIFILGEDKPLIMDERTAPKVLEYFSDLGRDMVVDYEHQTMADVEAPAAGWIKELSWRDDGLWARTDWTERGAAYIAAREYRYFSPVIVWRKSDRRIIALVNVALTNEPRTRNIQAIAAKHKLSSEGEEPMKDRLIALFKLSKDADEAAVEKAAKDLLAEAEELKAEAGELKKKLEQAGDKPGVAAAKSVLEALGVSGDADEAAVVAKVKSLSAGDTAAADLAAQVSTLSGKIKDMETDGLTARALKAGQTSPAELDSWGRDLARTDPEKFEKIVLSRPVGSVVPVGKTKIADKPSGDAPDDVQLEINKQMGISDDTWKKYGPGAAQD